jgi:myo-inositol-1(or 4)-monophosphatase
VSGRAEDLERIAAALDEARAVLRGFTGVVPSRPKGDQGPVTDADLAVDAALARSLPRPGEGWLSEESEDDPDRLARRRVWIVDPIDGTRQFLAGSPEWSVSVALVEDGRAVAGGVMLPARDLTIVGAEGLGVVANGQPARVRQGVTLDRACILASPSEHRRGAWDGYREAPFTVRTFGSIAAKLALVGAGLADATWTLEPRNEWDVAAGIALVLAGGGEVWRGDAGELRFNARRPVVPGLFAAPADLAREIRGWLADAGPRRAVRG